VKWVRRLWDWLRSHGSAVLIAIAGLLAWALRSERRKRKVAERRAKHLEAIADIEEKHREDVERALKDRDIALAIARERAAEARATIESRKAEDAKETAEPGGVANVWNEEFGSDA
jgi:hypothetical protein